MKEDKDLISDNYSDNKQKKFLVEEYFKSFNINSKSNIVNIFFIPINYSSDEYSFVTENNLEEDKYNGINKYYGSSTRLGKYYEIYNPDIGYTKIEFKILINNKIIFNKKIDFKQLTLDYLEMKKDSYDKKHLINIKEMINSDKICILDSFSRCYIKDKYIDINFEFRELHRFNNIVELCGIRFKLN